MTEKCVPREGNLDPEIADEASNNDEETSGSSDTTDKKSATLPDDLAGKG